MALTEITRAHVLQAVAEYDLLGQDAFLRHYQFGPARQYRLSLGGRLYDSKAIVGAAHGYATGRPLTSRGFTGGQATVGRLLEHLGFVVDRATSSTAPGHADSNNAQGSGFEGLLSSLRSLRVHHHDGRAAPYQYVVLLWALSRARTAHARLVKFSAAADELSQLLRPFALAATPPDPANPWLALRSSPWWQIDLPSEAADAGPVRWHRIRQWDSLAGLSNAAWDLVTGDGEFFREAVTTITEILRDEHGLPHLLDELGLSRALTKNLTTQAIVTVLPPEEHTTEQFPVRPQETTELRERRESRLLERYRQHLTAADHQLCRHQIIAPQEQSVLVTDLYDLTTGELIEAKSTTDRMTIRLALGQILDYAHHLSHKSKALLLPEPPSADLTALLHAHGVTVIWEQPHGGFTRAVPNENG